MTLTVHIGAESSRESIARVDSDFFKVIDLPLVAAARPALADPGSVVLSEAMAAKYFPMSTQTVIGKTCT